MRPTMRTRSRRGRLSSSWATQHVFEDHRRVVNAVLEGREVDRVLGERAAHGCVDQIGDAPVGLGRLDTEGPVKIGVKGNGGSLDDFAHGAAEPLAAPRWRGTWLSAAPFPRLPSTILWREREVPRGECHGPRW